MAEKTKKDLVPRELEALFRYLPYGLCIVDSEGRYVKVNDFFAKLNRLPAAEHPGKLLSDVIPFLYTDIKGYFDKVFETGEPVSGLEIDSLLLKDRGKEKSWIMDLFPVKAESGEIKELCVLLQETTTSRKTSRELSESQKRYKQLVTEARTIILEMDVNGRFTYMNECGLDFFGYSCEEIIGKTAFETIVPAIDSTGRDLEEVIHKIYENPDKFAVNVNENRKKSGERVWIEWHNKAIFDAEGKRQGHLAIGIDITQNLRDKEALKQSEQLFRTIAESIPALIWIVKASDSTILYVNGYNQSVYGFDKDEVIGKIGDENYYYPEDRKILHEIFISQGYADAIPMKIKKSNGEPFWGLTSMRRILFEGQDAIIGATIDITEYRKVEESLEKTRKKLDIALESGKIGTWEWDLINNKIAFDSRTDDIFGIAPGSFGGSVSDFLDLIHEEDVNSVNTAFENSKRGNPQLTILRTRPVDGIFKYVSITAVELKDRTNSPVMISGVCFDITDMKKSSENAIIRLNEELQRSNNALQQFAYVASHDLQEPLRMISSFTQLLQQKYHDRLDKNANEYINFAVEGSKRMYDLLNGLLAYSRVNTKGKEFLEIDMNSVVSQVQDNLVLLIKERNVQVICQEMPRVKADESQMIQLFQNLVENAIKFNRNPPVVSISASAGHGFYVFSVADNGIGIREQYYEKIFRIFQRLHGSEYKGTGIGLALCRNIVERHGGRLWVTSEFGKGSVFRFTIPDRSQ